jgi:hypothetical protein
MLVTLLKENGWYAYKEYEMDNYPRINALTGQTIDEHGFMDVCAFAHNKKLVIEYDNGNHLKTNSISKLFHSDADVPIGLVRGRRGKPFLRFENTSKIKRIAKNLGIAKKVIFLIVIENRIAEWIGI